MKLSENIVRLKVITAVLLKIQVIWDVMYCGSVPPDLLTNSSGFIFRVRQFFCVWLTQKMRALRSLKCQELLPQEHFTTQTN
jgi:hypothetical protein